MATKVINKGALILADRSYWISLSKLRGGPVIAIITLWYAELLFSHIRNDLLQGHKH